MIQCCARYPVVVSYNPSYYWNLEPVQVTAGISHLTSYFTYYLGIHFKIFVAKFSRLKEPFITFASGPLRLCRGGVSEI